MWRMLKQADRPALLTLLGASLIKFAAGIIGIWGATNIYFFSYLRNHGTTITPLTNSIILLCALFPSAFAMLLATKLSRVLGYKMVIRGCGILFAVFPYIINIEMNVVVLGLCYLAIPVSCLSISSVPVLNCLWSQFPTHLNKVSGIAVLCFSLGSIVFNIMFVHITNPHNQQALVDDNNQAYFTDDVAGNIFKASNVIFLVSGISYLVGSCLVEKKEQLEEEDQIQNQVHQQLQEESPPADNEEKGSQPQSSQKVAKLQQLPNQNQPIQNELKSSSSTQSLQQQKKQMKLREGLLDKRFLLLFGISYLVPLYLIYLSLYSKFIFMPIINDDYYLAYCTVMVTVGGIVAAPMWGCVGDHKGFKFTLLLIVFSDIVVKVLGIWCDQKWNIILLYFMLSFNDKGILTILGPGLIEMFGLEMATELIPYKGISLFIAYLTVPVFQIILPNYAAYKTLLVIFVGLSCVGVGLGLYFYHRIEYPSRPQKQREGERELQEKNYFP